MSSHYIYLSCSVPGCETRESIYTGEAFVYEFDDAEWEGETINVPCKHH